MTYAYVWYKDGVALEGETAATLQVSEDGSYAVGIVAMKTDGAATLYSAQARSQSIDCTIEPHQYVWTVIKEATTIVAINNNPNAAIFKNADYGIVGNLEDVLPLLAKALNCGEKQPAPAMKKMKRPFILKSAPEHARYLCNGCGYEYDQDFGDPENEIDPGTAFDQLPEEWICPECGEDKSSFIKVE